MPDLTIGFKYIPAQTQRPPKFALLTLPILNICVRLAGVFNTLFPTADSSQSSQGLGSFFNFTNVFQMQQQQQAPSEHRSLFSSSIMTPFPGMQSSMPHTSRAGSNPPGLLSTSLASSNGQAQQQPDQAEVSLPSGSQQLTPSLDPQLPIPPKRLPPVQAQRAPSAPPQARSSAAFST